MHKCRAFFVIIAMIAAVALGVSLGNNAREAQASVWQGEMIRLHVIARSDSETDQRIKLAVRDALLNAFSGRLQADTIQDASKAIEANLDEMQAVAEQTAQALGEPGPVTVSFGLHDFPTRVYGDTVVPAGTYQALRVVIGDGDGRNWWCVVYPSLCLVDADCAATQQEALPLDGAQPPAQVHFTSALWEWLQSLFQ